MTKSTASRKNTIKGSRKLLSTAAQDRAEKERQEAAKSKVEKLAESIKRRSAVSGKHNSVVEHVDAVKERMTKVKKIRVVPIQKVKRQAPINRSSEYQIFLAKTAEREKLHHKLIKQAEQLRNRISKTEARERVKFNEGLRDCYGMYLAVESSDSAYDFYDLLRSYFRVAEVAAISSTPDESLLIRYIFSSKSKKQVSEYATVLRYARETGVSKNDFISWYTSTTQTRILEKARKSGSEGSKDKLLRAKKALLRYFDLREQWPLGHFAYPEHLAAKQVHLPDDLIFVICRGVRRFDRDVEINAANPPASEVSHAEISALHFIPPNIDIVNDLIHRLATYLVPRIDEIENEIDQKTEQVWADDLSHLLMQRELGSAYKSTDHWSDRIQASVARDQHEFVEKTKKIQKMRNKARR